MAQTVKQDFPPEGGAYPKGTTIKDIGITITIAGLPPSSPITAAAIALKDCDTVYHRYDSADGSITIDPAGDKIIIVAHILDIPARDYRYDLLLTFDDGTVTRWMYGLWKVGEGITDA